MQHLRRHLAVLWPCFALAAGAGRGLQGQGVTPIQKVIDMLNDMAVKGGAEKQKEKVAFTKFKEFCRLGSEQKARAIARAEDDIKQLQATKAKAEADAEILAEAITGLEAQLAGWAEEEEKATSLRKEERKTYEVTHQDYSESINALERAIQALKTSSEDVPQAPAGQSSLLEVHRVAALPRLPAGAKQALEAFLQEGSGAAVAAPEANAYEFQSSEIVQMLEKLRLRFIDEQRALVKEEMNRKHAYEAVIQTLSDDTAHAESTRSKKVVAKAESLQDAADAKGDLTETETTKAADEAFLRDLKVNCQLKSSEFEKRQALRADELKAIEKAIEIISSPEVAGSAEKHLPSSLLQLRARGQAALLQARSAGGDAPPQERAAALLSERAQQTNSAFLASIASRLAEDPFAKVKKMIKDLLVKLMEEASEEAEHKGWCDGELATNKKSRDSLSDEVESLTSQVDEQTALISKLGEEISDLNEEIAEIDATMKKATEDRQAEKAKNAATVADAKAGKAAVTQALKVLKEFYASAGEATALVQAKQVPEGELPATWDSSYQGMQSSSSGVLGMLEVIQSDFARLEAETSMSESQSQREYEQFMSDTETDKEAKDRTMRHKGFKRDSTQRLLNRAKKELAGTQEELSDALEYFDKLKPSCLDTGLSYEERVQRRKEEIESLKEAWRILDAEDLTGMTT